MTIDRGTPTAITPTGRSTSASHFLVVFEPEWAESLAIWATRQGQSGNRPNIVVWAPDERTLAGVQDRIARTDLELNRFEFVSGSTDTAASIHAEIARRPGILPVIGPAPVPMLAELVFNQIPEEVPRKSGVVIVVPPGARPGPAAHEEHSPVAVGFHGSRPSLDALKWALEEAERRDTKLRVVLAWSEGAYGELGGCVAIGRGGPHLAGVAARDLAVATMTATGLPTDRVEMAAARGTPGRVLVNESRDCRLLVVGSGDVLVHGHRVLGPVTLSCITHSHVAVAIVPRDKKDVSAQMSLSGAALLEADSRALVPSL